MGKNRDDRKKRRKAREKARARCHAHELTDWDGNAIPLYGHTYDTDKFVRASLIGEVSDKGGEFLLTHCPCCGSELLLSTVQLCFSPTCEQDHLAEAKAILTHLKEQWSVRRMTIIESPGWRPKTGICLPGRLQYIRKK